MWLFPSVTRRRSNKGVDAALLAPTAVNQQKFFFELILGKKEGKMFDEELKEVLVSLQDALKARGVHGNYCPYGNLHMTLAFIGESYDLTAIRKAVSEVAFEPFALSLDKLGSFPTKAGVIWCRLKDNEPIIELARQLRESLKANEVSHKEDLFFPHISLVQHPSEIVTDIEVPETSMRVKKIFIMKSERVDGELMYSEI